MTKTKVRRILELAKELAKLGNDKAVELSHELEMLAHGAEDMPHKPRQVEASRFTMAIKTVIEALGDAPFALVGGLAVQHWVTIRATDDVDFVLATHDLEHVKKLFPGGKETALVYSVSIEGVSVDFMHSQIFPWTSDAIRHAVKKSESGVSLPIATPEYLILYKLKASRPRDHEDIKALLKHDKTIYSKARVLVQKYFAHEDVEDFDQLAHEASLGL